MRICIRVLLTCGKRNQSLQRANLVMLPSELRSNTASNRVFWIPWISKALVKARKIGTTPLRKEEAFHGKEKQEREEKRGDWSRSKNHSRRRLHPALCHREKPILVTETSFNLTLQIEDWSPFKSKSKIWQCYILLTSIIANSDKDSPDSPPRSWSW